MAAQDIEYVELYTSDKRSVVDYFTLALGFERVAECADQGRDSALLRRGEVQVVVSAGPGTHAFLDAHGDGVADIALTCHDVAASRDAAVAAGADPAAPAAGDPAVTAFGGVRHTLLPVPPGPGRRLPAHRGWTGPPAVPRAEAAPAAGTVPEAGTIRHLDHVAICLEGGSLADCADFYEAAFGLARYSSEYVDVGDQAMDSVVVRSPSGGVTFTLIAPDTSKNPGQLDGFLARNGGPGVQHLAFGVDDIIAAVRELGGRGVEFLRTPAAYYDALGERFPEMGAEIADLRGSHVLADRDEWGYLLQLFTRSPHDRNTLFYELIQRRGARGFGSANIRALYLAVERDRLAVE
jgi:4-hydroxymandelate synthase